MALRPGRMSRKPLARPVLRLDQLFRCQFTGRFIPRPRKFFLSRARAACRRKIQPEICLSVVQRNLVPGLVNLPKIILRARRSLVRCLSEPGGSRRWVLRNSMAIHIKLPKASLCFGIARPASSSSEPHAPRSTSPRASPAQPHCHVQPTSCRTQRPEDSPSGSRVPDPAA